MSISDLYSFMIGGPAGFGIKSVGLVFARVATRSGYETFTYSEYPSLIRGGHNVVQTVVSKEPVYAPVKHTNFLVALDQNTIDLHRDELVDGAGVLFDKGLNLKTDGLKDGVHVFEIPLLDLVRENGGQEVMRNTMATAAVMALLGADLKHFKDLVAAEFAHKPPEVTELNHKMIDVGYEYAKENFKDTVSDVLAPKEKVEKRMVINGNEAAARGAIAAGLQFAAIYPMTPTSNTLHNLAPHQEKYGFVYKQPEDELAAIGMAMGAAHAGARAMVATSGGGMALMSEFCSLVGLTETPMVMLEGMRGAPATGLPTWTEQGDLKFALNVGHGDYPRIVLAPGDSKEVFECMMQAFNLADKYQTLVIVISDKMTLESDQSYPLFNYDGYEVDRGKLSFMKVEDYKRYEVTEDGVSPRSPVGTGNFMIANADEHDEYGYANEEIDNRNAQMEKRMRKLEKCIREDMQGPELFGSDDAQVTIVSWGSNKGSILEAMKELPQVKYVHNIWMNPFPAAAMRDELQKANYLLGIECNISGQYLDVVAEKTGVRVQDTMLKYDGRPIYPEEIIDKVRSITS